MFRLCALLAYLARSHLNTLMIWAERKDVYYTRKNTNVHNNRLDRPTGANKELLLWRLLLMDFTFYISFSSEV
jgi:hypothetical protein